MGELSSSPGHLVPVAACKIQGQAHCAEGQWHIAMAFSNNYQEEVFQQFWGETIQINTVDKFCEGGLGNH